jgi:leucyl/phenylalanyl-tRNA--protein transferase
MGDREAVEWCRPRGRTLIPLDDRFTTPRSLRARVGSGRFEIRSDTAFGRVVRACAEPGPGREQTWLHPVIIHAFELLRRAGHAHSVEAWLPGTDGGVLVGGLYGLAIAGAFCGESMFSRPHLGGTDASKVCLVHLVHHLRRRGFALLDAQLRNPHLEQFGAFNVTSATYTRMLGEALSIGASWGDWDRGDAGTPTPAIT